MVYGLQLTLAKVYGGMIKRINYDGAGSFKTADRKGSNAVGEGLRCAFAHVRQV